MDHQQLLSIMIKSIVRALEGPIKLSYIRGEYPSHLQIKLNKVILLSCPLINANGIDDLALLINTK